MFVIKRDGTQESVKFDKITARVQKLSYGLDPAFVDPIQVAKKVIDGVYDGVSTVDLDNLAFTYSSPAGPTNAVMTATKTIPINSIVCCSIVIIL